MTRTAAIADHDRNNRRDFHKDPPVWPSRSAAPAGAKQLDNYDGGWGGRNRADFYGDVRSMPQVADASFDSVFCIYVLEHIDDVDAAVKEIWRVLKPSGALIFGLPLDYQYHGGPMDMDFWRFSEAGTRQLLERFTISAMLPCGDGHPFTIDSRLKFYGPPVQSGPLGYVGAAIKPAT